MVSVTAMTDRGNGSILHTCAAVPAIAIVIATKEAARTIPHCLASIRSQGLCMCMYEVVVVDSASRDGTAEMLGQDSLISWWISKPDRGIAHAWNRAIPRLKAQWVLYLGADDVLASPDVLENMLQHLRENQDALVVFGSVRLAGGAWHGLVVGGPHWKRQFSIRMTIPHQGAFHHRALYDLVGLYDEGYVVALDYELLLRLKSTNRIVYVPELVSVMASGGLSSRLVEQSLTEAARAQVANRTLPTLAIWFAKSYFLGRHRLRVLRQNKMVLP